MSSGLQHDQSIMLWGLPFSLIMVLIFGLWPGLIGGIAFVIGGLWLSPDLDTNSKVLKRWGVFQIFWWPYQKSISHRSILSHGPFIGTIIRLTYVSCWILSIFILLKLFGTIDELEIRKLVIEKQFINQTSLLVIFIGIEASAWLHLIKDGDPLPLEWKKWGKK